MSDPTATPAADALYQEALATFGALLEDARAAGDPEPTAMTLATAVGTRVSARIVLLKGFDARGFRFFTNRESDKGAQLAAQPRLALCFHWKTLRDGVQVRIEGRALELADAESDAYFATRPRGSQLGAWASLQSRTLPDRAELDARVAEMEKRFAGADVPRPPDWGGYRVVPDMIELWFGQRARLHDRERYESSDGLWTKRLLYP